MKTILIVAVVILLPIAVHAQLITTFGANAQNGGNWNYDDTSSTLTGIEGGGDLLFGTPLTLSYSGSQIQISANVTTAPPGGFTFELFDAEDDQVIAAFDWNDFIGGATVTSILSVNPLFNYSNVVVWNLVGGSSGSPINAVLVSASVVPEPSSMALLALGAIGFFSRIRRRVA